MVEDLEQCAHPHGAEGENTIRGMNEEHIPQIQWGLDNLPDISPKKILDIGCGGGIFTRLALEKYPEAKAWGIDISELSIQYSKKFNEKFLREGRLVLGIGNVAHMPFSDGFFDLVVSNASHFFWPDLPENLKEVARIVKKDGIVCLTAGVSFDDESKVREYKRKYPSVNTMLNKTLKGYMDDAGLRTEYSMKPDTTFCCHIGVKE